LDFGLDDFSDDSKFDKWNEAFIADTEAKAAEAETEWGAGEELVGEPE
jgi:hypothetical protein